VDERDGELARDSSIVPEPMSPTARTMSVICDQATVFGAAEIRAARGFLSWTARDLAEKAGVSFSTVRRIEDAQGTSVRKRNLDAIRETLERHGIFFVRADFGASGMIFVAQRREEQA